MENSIQIQIKSKEPLLVSFLALKWIFSLFIKILMTIIATYVKFKDQPNFQIKGNVVQGDILMQKEIELWFSIQIL